MSSDNKDAIPPGCVHAIWVSSVRSTSAISTDLPHLPPIWASERRPACSAASRSRFAVVASIIFPTVLSRAMGY
jgi:hypothetical protein